MTTITAENRENIENILTDEVPIKSERMKSLVVNENYASGNPNHSGNLTNANLLEILQVFCLWC